LTAAHSDYISRVEPYRSAVWWSAISLVALLLAAGPPLYASIRKLRNTPGWPFLVGAATAVLFSFLAGIARGGVEHAWLAFFPWLTVSAVAPERQGGEPVPPPLLLSGVGAAVAIVIEAVLATPW
jgi:methylthioxylose transferase